MVLHFVNVEFELEIQVFKLFSVNCKAEVDEMAARVSHVIVMHVLVCDWFKIELRVIKSLAARGAC